MAVRDENDCIKKALPDEELFVLMARDVTSPQTILYWISQNVGIQPEEKLREAFICAMKMKNQRVLIDSQMKYMHPVVKALVAKGWTIDPISVMKKELTRLIRPGKENGSGFHAQFNHNTELLHVFTTATIFESNIAYSPEKVFAVLEATEK